MKTIVGCGVEGSNSAECASAQREPVSGIEKLKGSALLAFHTTNVSCPFDTGDLETKTDTQEGYLLLPCPPNGGNHTLRASKSESTRNNDTSDSTSGQ